MPTHAQPPRRGSRRAASLRAWSDRRATARPLSRRAPRAGVEAGLAGAAAGCLHPVRTESPSRPYVTCRLAAPAPMPMQSMAAAACAQTGASRHPAPPARRTWAGDSEWLDGRARESVRAAPIARGDSERRRAPRPRPGTPRTLINASRTRRAGSNRPRRTSSRRWRLRDALDTYTVCRSSFFTAFTVFHRLPSAPRDLCRDPRTLESPLVRDSQAVPRCRAASLISPPPESRPARPRPSLASSRRSTASP